MFLTHLIKQLSFSLSSIIEKDQSHRQAHRAIPKCHGQGVKEFIFRSDFWKKFFIRSTIIENNWFWIR
jgi:hypothetical protein